MKNESRNLTQKKDPSRNESLKILVVGATGGTGKATVELLLKDGHNVTAFSRSANSLSFNSDRLSTINGDACNAEDVDRAVNGHNVVIVTLGISDNPFRVRLFGTKHTPMNVRSAGTSNVIKSMHKHGVRRLVAQSSYGVGDTRVLLSFADKMFFNLILHPQIKDTEIQENIIRNSGLDWVISQPVHLTDENFDSQPFISSKGQANVMKVSRKSAAKFLVDAACNSLYNRKSFAISGMSHASV